MSADLQRRIESLQPRELECLRGVTELKRTDQIAAELGLAPKTHHSYVARAAKRLGVNDRDSAARLLIEGARMPWGKSLSGFLGVATPAQSPASPWLSQLPWPWPTRWRPENDLGFGMKLVLIVALATFMMLGVAAYLGVVLLIDRIA